MSSEATAAWFKQDLDSMKCEVPGCAQPHHHGPLILNSRCHPGKRVDVRYRYGGILEATCSVCDRHVFNVRVAPEEQEVIDPVVTACGDPACKDPPESHALKLNPKCHRNSGAYVIYDAGVVTLACGACQSPIQAMKIKERSANA